MLRCAVVVMLLVGPALATPRAGFAAYKNARLLCIEHVTGNTMHLTWTSYATRDPVETVVAHYEKTTNRKASAGDNGVRTFKWDANHQLAVYPADKNDSFPHCEQKPKAGERAVIMMSSASRP